MRAAFSEVTFGRGAELAGVREFLAGAHTSPRVLLVTGPAGIGKTHLLREARAVAVDRDIEWLQGSGTWVPGVSEHAAAYAPLREAMRSTDLALLLDGPLSEAAHLEPLLHRQQELATALAARGRVVLAVDDLQWVDRSSLAVLLHLVHHGGPSVLLAVGSRPVPADEPAGALIEHLRRQPETLLLELTPMPAAAVADLVDASSDVPAQRRNEIVGLAAGNPLAAVELARHPGSRVPATIAATVRQRLATAPPDAVRAASAAAVLGEDEEQRSLREVLGRLGVRSVDDAVAGAVSAQLLWPGGHGYVFAHPLEREAVYDALLPQERTEIHTVVADVLSACDPTPERLAAIALNRHGAGDDAGTVTASLAAAAAAASAGAYPEALAHEVRALASARRAPDLLIDLDEETARAAELARWAGRPDEGLRLLDDRLAAPGCASAQLWAKVGWLRREIGDVVGAGLAYRRAVEALDGTPDHIRARVMAALATWHMVQSRNAAALAACDEALELLEPGPSSTRAHLLITRGVVLADTGEVADGLRLLEDGRRAALEVGDESELWRYVGNVTYVLENTGRPAEAVTIALQAYERARRAHVEESLTVLPTAVNAVVALTELIRFEEATTLAEQVLQGPLPGSSRALVLATLALGRGRQARPDEAWTLLAAASDAAGDDVDDVLLERIAMAEAEAALADADPTRSRAAADRAIAAAERVEDEDHLARALATAFRVEHGLGADPSRLAALAARRPPWEFPDALHARVCDVEAAAAGPGRPAVDPLDEWSQIARRAQHVDLVLAAYARLRGAEEALAHKDRRATTVALSTALRDLAPAGRTFVAAQIEHLALVHHLALPPDGGPDEQPRATLALGLTRRETEVLGMLVEGASNRQIGRALGITEKTASVHVSRVITKLGVSTRLEAAAKAHRERLL